MTNPGPAGESRPPAPRRAAGPRPLVDWVQITANLQWAHQWAVGIGNRLPELKRFRGIFRVLARSIAGCFIFAARVITNPQQEFNLSMINLLSDLINGLRVVDKGQRAVVNHLEYDVDRRLLELENTVQRLSAQLSQPAARERAA